MDFATPHQLLVMRPQQTRDVATNRLERRSLLGTQFLIVCMFQESEMQLITSEEGQQQVVNGILWTKSSLLAINDIVVSGSSQFAVVAISEKRGLDGKFSHYHVGLLKGQYF